METPFKLEYEDMDGEPFASGETDLIGFPSLSLDEDKSIPVAFKRSAHLITVEGSPMITQKMRIDSNPTPVKISSIFREATVCSQPHLQSCPIREELEYKILAIATDGDSHDTGDHQESMLRTKLLCGEVGCLRRSPLESCLSWASRQSMADIPITDLLRVHEYSYLKHLETKCQLIGSNQAGGLPPFYAPSGYLDSDTPIGPLSLSTAKAFCSSAIHAVDVVMEGFQKQEREALNAIRRAFVIGRPPGHHAGPNGCVVSEHYWRRPDMASSGFCLLNTAAIAAAYARYRYGHSCSRPPRIAIVDIDVHHGNGTEDIVRNLRPHEVFLPLPSSWAPVKTVSYKPWLNEQDADEVFFSSVHLFAEEQFYPCSGREHPEDNNIVNICLTPLGPGPWDPKARAKLTKTQRHELIQLANTELRSKVSTMLLPKLAAFSPDLLILSSGFDTHHDDLYHFLDESSIHWLTESLCTCVAACGGRVVSILEGGYSLESTSAAGSKPSTRTKPKTEAAEAVSAGASANPANPQQRAGRGKNKKYDDDDAAMEAQGSVGSFAQQPVDGGLVKGVLAHLAALAGRKSW